MIVSPTYPPGQYPVLTAVARLHAGRLLVDLDRVADGVRLARRLLVLEEDDDVARVLGDREAARVVQRGLDEPRRLLEPLSAAERGEGRHGRRREEHDDRDHDEELGERETGSAFLSHPHSSVTSSS
jgi:hypothetical protein